ncbi:Putative O-antigen polymerase [Desulfonema limicola]|uniref:O-antigen polymerase n=1 Tax=Desulfonema limicola TaxID=45656 RepID=A0A975B5M1_9BACT|nr:O-antigen ligase family protein [Desulfonema limicola]QTA79207.1 Putative O-antigen polymerase [Desulfonema limicola]
MVDKLRISTSNGKKFLSIRQAELILQLMYFSILMFSVFRWRETFTVFSEGSTGALLIRVGVMFPALIGILIAIFWGKPELIPSSWRILYYWAGLTFISGIVIGIFNSFSLRYLLGDAFRYTISWASFFACLLASMSLALISKKKILFYFHLYLIISIFDAIATCWLSIKFPWARISTLSYIFLILWGIMYIKEYPYCSYFFIFLGIITLILSGKRGTFIVMAILSPFLMCFFIKSTVKSIISFIIFIVLIFAISEIMVDSDIKQHISKRYESLLNQIVQIVNNVLEGGQGDKSTEGRFFELYNIELYYQRYPLEQLSGVGFGAEIPMVYYTGVLSNSGHMHHVHISWGVYFLRHGINGIILLASYFFLCFLYSKKYLFSNSKFSVFLLIMTFFEFILAFKGNIMLESIQIIPAICISVIWSDLYITRNQIMTCNHSQQSV